MDDKYLTLTKPAEALYKEKASKFFALAYPCKNEEEAKVLLEEIKGNFHDARHHCYAYRFGADKSVFRANDDGEPSNTAGKPILGQIQAFDLTDVLVVVVRYFGGTKLGVGGLISAYKEAAAMALENASIVEKTVYTEFEIRHTYEEMNHVMRLIKERDLEVVKQDMNLQCTTIVGIRASQSDQLEEQLSRMHKLSYKRL